MDEQVAAKRRVMSTISYQLTEFFGEYLGENIGEDILSSYYEGFTVTQVAEDLHTAIKNWANQDTTLQALTTLVTECADEYLDAQEEF